MAERVDGGLGIYELAPFLIKYAHEQLKDPRHNLPTGCHGHGNALRGIELLVDHQSLEVFGVQTRIRGSRIEHRSEGETRPFGLAVAERKV